jgi:hypothetical protein
MHNSSLRALFLAVSLVAGSAQVAAAAQNFNPSATQELIELAQNSAARDDFGLQARNVLKARLLLKQGADPAGNDGAAMVEAARYNQLGLLKLLHEEGHVDLNLRHGLALTFAAMNECDEAINYLIDNGMDPDGLGKTGRPLGEAAKREHLSTTELLVKRGANVNVNNGNPLGAASFEGSLKGVRKLIELKADINAGQGVALSAALQGGKPEMVQFLLIQGADPTLVTVTAGLKEIRDNPDKYAGQGYQEAFSLLIRARELKASIPVSSPAP